MKKAQLRSVFNGKQFATAPAKEGATNDAYFEKKHNWIADVSVILELARESKGRTILPAHQMLSPHLFAHTQSDALCYGVVSLATLMVKSLTCMCQRRQAARYQGPRYYIAGGVCSMACNLS